MDVKLDFQPDKPNSTKGTMIVYSEDENISLPLCRRVGAVFDHIGGGRYDGDRVADGASGARGKRRCDEDRQLSAIDVYGVGADQTLIRVPTAFGEQVVYHNI